MTKIQQISEKKVELITCAHNDDTVRVVYIHTEKLEPCPMCILERKYKELKNALDVIKNTMGVK